MAETTGTLGTRPLREAAKPGALDGLDCTVTISRDHPRDCGQRQVFARLDDAPRVTLLFGQTVTIEVEAGSHVLRLDNTLFRKKIRFAIEPGEHLEFSIINYARWWTAGMVGVLGWAPLFLSVRKTSLQ